MSSLFLVASKCKATPRGFTIINGVSIVKRGLALAGNYCAVKIDSIPQSRFLMKKAKSESQRTGRSFCDTSLRLSLKKANVDSNNVLSSPFPDIHGFNDVYFHELIYKNLNLWADKTAVICSATGRGYTYAQMKKLSGRLATSLRKNNIRPGGTIAIVLPNVPEYALVILAGSEAGIRMTLINPAYTPTEMKNQIENSKSSAVFTVPSKHSVVSAAISNNPNIGLPIIMIEDGNGAAPPGTIKFKDLVRDDVEEFKKTGHKTVLDPEDTLFLPYSSGTSGLPKGVELSHRNLVANIMQASAKGVSLAEPATDTHQDIVPLILPLYHIYGLTEVCCVNLCMGGKLVTMPQFSPDNFLNILENNRSTILYLAPPLLQLLANDERLNNRHVESVKLIVSGAAPIATDVLEKFDKSKHLKLVQGYGLTETSPAITMSNDCPFESTGYAVSNTQIRVVGYETENMGKNLGFDEVGELFVRGPQVMKGYFNNRQATVDCMDGEWFKTGDMACYNEKGMLFIHGRRMELIRVQGLQVAPAELEHLIQAHDKVLDAAVIGVPDTKYGEVPKAFVVPRSGAKIDPSEIKAFVAERVSKHKHLRHVKFIEKIPKSASGKILRKELQEM